MCFIAVAAVFFVVVVAVVVVVFGEKERCRVAVKGSEKGNTTIEVYLSERTRFVTLVH